jgi:hypothetical protein
VLNRSIDLSSCDTEPIHVIGAIQPFGFLIAADRKTLAIEFASSNTEEYVGRSCGDLLGQPLSALLGEANLAELMVRPLTPSLPDLLRPWFARVPRPDGSVPIWNASRTATRAGSSWNSCPGRRGRRSCGKRTGCGNGSFPS